MYTVFFHLAWYLSHQCLFSIFSHQLKSCEKDSKIISESENHCAPFSMWLFGEITPCSVSTLHQASGNHYIGCLPISTLSPFWHSHSHTPSCFLTRTTNSLRMRLRSRTFSCWNAPQMPLPPWPIYLITNWLSSTRSAFMMSSWN